MKRDTGGRIDAYPKVDGHRVTGNMDVLALSMESLDRVIKELIMTEEDVAHSACGVTSQGSLLKMVGGSLRTKILGFVDGGIFSIDGDKGLTRDAKVERKEGVKLT